METEEQLKLQKDSVVQKQIIHSLMEYMWTCEHFMSFRAEMLYHDNKEKQTSEERNAESIANFLKAVMNAYPEYKDVFTGKFNTEKRNIFGF